MANDFLIILSPSLGMDFEKPTIIEASGKATYMKEVSQIMSELKKTNVSGISKLMKTSEDITASVIRDIKRWSDTSSSKKSRAAIAAFTGVVYQGLQAGGFGEDQLKTCQNRVRIISGLYGYLRPLDAIQSYRLEMKTTLRVGGHSNLYKFWGDKINKAVLAEKLEIVLNLSSKEYSRLLSEKECGKRIVTVDFRNKRKGKLTLLSYHAKRARGLLARDIITARIQNVEAIQDLEIDSYKYSSEYSGESNWMFISDS